MKILIDADGCPVVDICIKSAKRHGIECLILCDTSHIFEREGAKTVTVSKGADSVDFRTVKLTLRSFWMNLAERKVWLRLKISSKSWSVISGMSMTVSSKKSKKFQTGNI